MDAQDFWKLLHVGTLVYWVGADVGVFYAAHLITNPAYSPQTRAVLLKVLAWIDMFPRYMLLLTFPVGAQLAAGLDLALISGAWLWLVWIAAAGWIFMVREIHRREGTAAARTLGDIDLTLRIVFIGALVASAISSFGVGQPYATTWLAVKVLLFAGAVSCGVGIRFAFKPFVPAFQQLVAEGSTPEVEARMKGALALTRPFVIGIWIFAAATAFIGLNHERLFGS